MIVAWLPPELEIMLKPLYEGHPGSSEGALGN